MATFPRYWPFVRGIHRSPVNSLHKGQWRGALMFSLICVWINDWINNRQPGNLRRHRDHYDVTVVCEMIKWYDIGEQCVDNSENGENTRTEEIDSLMLPWLMLKPELLLPLCRADISTLQWPHNERDGVSNHPCPDCLLKRLFGCRSKKISTLSVTGLCVWNSPVIGEFPAQRDSNAEIVSFWWRQHEKHFLKIIIYYPWV